MHLGDGAPVWNRADNPSAMTGGGRARRVLGVCVIAASGLWLLVWAFLAALVETFGSDARGAWVSIAISLALGVLGVAVGVCLVRGSYPGRAGLAVWGVAMLAPFLLAFQDDHGAAGVNAAVEAAYLERSDVRAADADCGYAEQNQDGSEFWVCDVETRPYDLDTCNVDMTRPRDEPARAEITFCLNDVSERIEDVVDAVGRSAGVLDRLLGDRPPGTK